MVATTFSKNRVLGHVEKLGFDVRPVLEVKLEKTKLFDFGQFLIETYPQFFQSVVQGSSQFSLRKTVVFLGKGEGDFETFTLTPRGPVFTFPRRIAEADEETDLPEANEIVRGCLKRFQSSFPDRKIFRAGKVNEYLFSCDDVPGKRIIAERFLTIDQEVCSEVELNVNLANTEFNRWIKLRGVQGVTHRLKEGRVENVPVHALAAIVDLNNRDVATPLGLDQISSVLRAADEFSNIDLYRFLNQREI